MKLFYRRYGSGDPVIILHGVFGISDNWVTIGRKLANNFEVFIPDMRNHGQSPHSPTINYFSMVDDLLEFIEEHEIEDPVLIGHSMGGKVAMNFVLDVALPVKKLVVVDIGPGAYTPRQIHLRIIRAMKAVNFDSVQSRSDVENIIMGSLNDKKLIRFILKNLHRINEKRYGWRLNIDAINENLENISGGINLSNSYSNPSLFILGGASDYVTEDDQSLILEYFDNAQFKTIQNATHWVHADHPDELCSILSDFLGKACDLQTA